MIHADHRAIIIEYLLNQLKEASTDIVRHGACLCLGFTAMGTVGQDIYEQLKFNLYQYYSVITCICNCYGPHDVGNQVFISHT